MADLANLYMRLLLDNSSYNKNMDESIKKTLEMVSATGSLKSAVSDGSSFAAMQQIATNLKNTISSMSDPMKIAKAFREADAQMKNLTGAETVKNAWNDMFSSDANVKSFTSAWNSMGAEFNRQAQIIESAERETQAAMRRSVAEVNATEREYAAAKRRMAQEASAAAREQAQAEKEAARIAAQENKITAEKLAWNERIKQEAIRATAQETKSATEEMGGAVKKSNTIFSNFFGSLTRIAKLRMLRGIIRMLTQAVKEGTTNIYQCSIAMNNADASHFSSTMNSLASSFLYLKNSIGSVIAPLLSSLVPALQTVIGWVSAALNVLAQFFAVLNGQSTYTRAKQNAIAWKEVGTAAGGAAAAANEYKNTILSFDEIHALNDTSGGGGGGGGGAGAPNYGDMFEEAELATSGIAGAFNRLATALKPILSGIWKFTSQMITDIFDGFALAADACVAVFSGDAEAIKKVFNDMGKFISTHPVLKWIANATLDVAVWANNAIDNIKLAILDAFDWFINLPIVHTILDALGVDVDELSGKIDAQREKINKHKESVANNRTMWALWAEGVDTDTARAIISTTHMAVENVASFGKVKKSADDAAKSAGGFSWEVEEANKSNPSFTGIINGFDQTSNSIWGAYANAVALGNQINWLKSLNGTVVNVGFNAVKNALGFKADGGFVTGYASGGIIPSYANGSINTADVFMANENGNTELVGRIGNRTAVANQEQMVDILTNGVARALSNVMGGQSSNLEVNVMMDREVLAKAVDRGNRSLNRRYNVSLA